MVYQREYAAARSRRIRRRKRRQRVLFAKSALSVFVICCCLFILREVFLKAGTGDILARTSSGTEATNEITQMPESGETPDTEALPSIELTDLYSPNAVLLDLESGQVLAGRASAERIYPASMTKIMTALLVIENIPDLSVVTTLSEWDFVEVYTQNASRAGFEPGEEVSFYSLLYGMLLPSGAECCTAGAEAVAGSEAEFVKLMNDKAAELGMADTHFCNASGLHDAAHYSTVSDMARLLSYALGNETFKEIFTSRRYTVPASNIHAEGFTMQSTLFKYLESPEVTGGEILGGKTGYTQEAGLCLASLAQVNGRQYILVTAGAPGDHGTEQYHILDAVKVYSMLYAS